MREQMAAENGVTWSSEQHGSNVLHVMEFDGQALLGSWVGARWVFQALTTMSPEERAQPRSYDEWMGLITARIHEWKESRA